MARTTLKLKRPITEVEVDLDENQLEVCGWAKVVRCKECIHWLTVVHEAEYGLCDCKIIGTRHKDDFCSSGQRKEE